jgi:hypothetical protein
MRRTGIQILRNKNKQVEKVKPTVFPSGQAL